MVAVEAVTTTGAITALCLSVGLARATLYRRRQLARSPTPTVRAASPRALAPSTLVAELFSDLSIAASHSRPRVSNDNPFSEAQFRTFKYRPEFPDRFGSIKHAHRCPLRARRRDARGPASHAPRRVRRASRALRARSAAPRNPSTRGLDQSAGEHDHTGGPRTDDRHPGRPAQHGEIRGPQLIISDPQRSTISSLESLQQMQNQVVSNALRRPGPIPWSATACGSVAAAPAGRSRRDGHPAARRAGPVGGGRIRQATDRADVRVSPRHDEADRRIGAVGAAAIR